MTNHTHTPQILYSHISDLPSLVDGDSDIPALGRTSLAESLFESLLILPLPSSSHFLPLDHSPDIQSCNTTIGTLPTDGVPISIPLTLVPSRESETRQSSTTLDHMENPGSQDCLTNCQKNLDILLPYRGYKQFIDNMPLMHSFLSL